MKLNIQRNHDANNAGGGNNAGATDLSGLGIGDDKSLANSSTTTNTDNNGGQGNTNNNSDTGETAEVKAAREAAEQAANTKLKADEETAKKFGGVKLDANGNAVDATGKVVKTAEEIKTASAPTAVTIDNVTYQLNEAGDAIDKDGKVVKTKVELDALENEEVEIPLVDELQQKSGYKLLDDKGQPKKYEDTPEGWLQLTNDIAVEKNKESIKKFFETYPDLEDFANHLKRGGLKEDYFKKQTTSWTNTKLDEKNEEQLTNVVVTDLMATGMSKEQALETAKLYKDTDKLKEFGKAAYTRLTTAEKAKETAAEQEYNQRVAEENKKIEAHWTNVQAVIKKGTLNNITIPESDREPFFEYLAIDADGNGNSKSAIERSKMPVELQLQLDYLQFKKFDLKTLITNAVKTEQANTLRKRTKGTQSGVGGGEGVDKTKLTKPNDANISIDTVV